MLKAILNNLNLYEFGVTNLSDFSYLQDIFNKKKQKNYFSDFDEQNFNKRNNLKDVMPNVKSVISIVFPYNTGESFTHKEYQISKYALRRDYHSVVHSLLEKLIKELEILFPNENFEKFVDSNPLFEKEIAVKAGLGFYGYNSLLINKKYGSFVFLGEILSSVKFEENKKEIKSNFCETCKLCIRACPNNCLSSDGLFNSKECISFLTSSKASIDAKKIYNKFWGCDICQDVCPLNKNVEYSNLEEFKIINDSLSLEEIIFTSNKKLSLFYKKFAFSWRGVKVLKRNAIILMGNSKKKSYIEVLEKFINTSKSEELILYAKQSLKSLIGN